MTTLTEEQQTKIIEAVRAMVNDRAPNRQERRHSLMCGVIIALQAVDHNLVPPHWLMNVMAGRSDRLFK